MRVPFRWQGASPKKVSAGGKGKEREEECGLVPELGCLFFFPL
jgi:hypothetical protein